MFCAPIFWSKKGEVIMMIEANTIPQNGAQLAGLVKHMVNIFGNEAAQEDFVESLAKSHRELQSSITLLVLKYLKLVAEGGRDGRNEKACEIAECAVKAIKEKYPYFY